jgi:hypothetical protein
MIGLQVQNKLNISLRYFFLSRAKGIYLEIFIYCFTLGFYGLCFDKFVSWWGIALSNFQIKTIASICLFTGLLCGVKFFRDVCLLLKKGTILLKDFRFLLKILFSWAVLATIFVFQIAKFINLPSFLFLIGVILFVVSLEFSAKKFDEVINK